MLTRIFIVLFLLASFCALALAAEEVSVIMDSFYGGLADVIEVNMQNPDRAVAEVDAYYKNNRASVEKIRSLAEKNLALAMASNDESAAVGSMVPEGMEVASMQEGVMSSNLTKGSARYANALEDFTRKHPWQGAKIASRSLDLLPGRDLFIKQAE